MDSYLRARVCPRSDANLMFLDQTHLTTFFRVDEDFWPLYEQEVAQRVRVNPRMSTYLHQIGGDRLFLDVDGPADPHALAASALALCPGATQYTYAINTSNGHCHLIVDHPCSAEQRTTIATQLAASYPVDVRCSSMRLPFSRKRAYQSASGIYDHIYNEHAEELNGVDALRRMSTYR